MERIYWKGIEELQNDAEFQRLRDHEFSELLPLSDAELASGTTRRDFLKYLGFGLAAASLAACEAPVRKTIPYLIKPEEITPGVPNFYASTFFDGHDYGSVLVKTREGRPIKIEGNELSPVNAGGTNARTQASLLMLYDNGRLQHPKANGQTSDWKTVDQAIIAALKETVARQGNIRILSSTIISPSTRKVIQDFTARYPNTKHIQYDAISYSGMIHANRKTFGEASIPSYHFEKASCVVAFECDFLGNWIAPVLYARQFAQTRRVSQQKKTMSRHFQFEANLSLAGANADYRYKLPVHEHGAALMALYNLLAEKAGKATVGSASVSVMEGLKKAADELWKERGQSLVISGSNQVHHQIIVNAINHLLGNYGSTIDWNRPCYLKQGSDEAVKELLTEIQEGKVHALIFYNSNPVYTLAEGEKLAGWLKDIPLTVAITDREDETATHCKYICPDHHYLESWNDAEPFAGIYSTCQPAIRPLFNTRQGQESLLIWAESTVTDFHEYLKTQWNSLLAGSGKQWHELLQEGVFEKPINRAIPGFNENPLAEAAASVLEASKGIGLVLYEMTAMGNGSQANNPWLLELPDPISRLTWDNYFAVSITFANKTGLRQGNIIAVQSGNQTLKGPVLIQPGMADDTVAVAYGYGRTHAGKAGNGVGINAYRLSRDFQHLINGVEIQKTVDEDHRFAGIQTHHTLMGRGRDIIKETTLEAWQKDPASNNTVEKITTYKGKQLPHEVDLWATPEQPGFDKPNHLWGMVIDLNTCFGCGACVIACTAENNVPVVGKDEVRRTREMHWIRIDRYYSSDAEPRSRNERKEYSKMELPSDNPQVVFQPMMCQHCNHAPCETVCPVAATPHSSEGINMMAYNRCIGTRYCQNNCPYKVRRFNWFKYFDNDEFDYHMNSETGRMVLNPDVIVRSRGVMEKCSLCVQRIQAGKLQAKQEGRRPYDGEIKTACAQACPTHAIVFGDYLDQKSEVTDQKADPRSYHVLPSLNTQPNVYYKVKIRNT